MTTKNRMQAFIKQLPQLTSEHDFNQAYRKIIKRQYDNMPNMNQQQRIERQQQKLISQKQQISDKPKDNDQQLKRQKSELNMTSTRKKFNINDELLTEAMIDLENYSSENILQLNIKTKFSSLEDFQATLHQLKKEISNQRIQFTLKKCLHYLTYSKVIPYLQLHNFNVINTTSQNEIQIEEQIVDYFKTVYQEIENLMEMNQSFKVQVRSGITNQYKLQKVNYQCNMELEKLKKMIQESEIQIKNYNSSTSVFQKIYQENNQKIINLNMQMHKYLNVIALLAARDQKFQLDVGTNKLLQTYFKEVTFSKLSSMNMGVSAQIYNNMKMHANLNIPKILNMITQIYTNDDVCQQIQSLDIYKKDENQSEKSTKSYKLKRSEFNFMNNHSSIRFENANNKMSLFDEIQEIKLNQSYYTFRKQPVIRDPDNDNKFKLSYNIKRQIFLQQEIYQMFMVQMYCRQEYQKEEVLIRSNQSNEQKFIAPNLRFMRSAKIQKVRKVVMNQNVNNESKFIAPYERFI